MRRTVENQTHMSTQIHGFEKINFFHEIGKFSNTSDFFVIPIVEKIFFDTK